MTHEIFLLELTRFPLFPAAITDYAKEISASINVNSERKKLLQALKKEYEKFGIYEKEVGRLQQEIEQGSRLIRQHQTKQKNQPDESIINYLETALP